MESIRKKLRLKKVWHEFLHLLYIHGITGASGWGMTEAVYGELFIMCINIRYGRTCLSQYNLGMNVATRVSEALSVFGKYQVIYLRNSRRKHLANLASVWSTDPVSTVRSSAE